MSYWTLCHEATRSRGSNHDPLSQLSHIHPPFSSSMDEITYRQELSISKTKELIMVERRAEARSHVIWAVWLTYAGRIGLLKGFLLSVRISKRFQRPTDFNRSFIVFYTDFQLSMDFDFNFGFLHLMYVTTYCHSIRCNTNKVVCFL